MRAWTAQQWPPLTQQHYQNVDKGFMLQAAAMPGCEYTYQLIQISIPHAIKLVVMSNRRRTRFISVSQVYRTCLSSPLVCSYDSFRRACCKGNDGIVISGDDQSMLAKLGGLPAAASQSTIVTVAAGYQTLKQYSIPQQMLSAFQNLKANPVSQIVLELPDHVMAPCAQPSTNPPQLQMAVPFPTTLPEVQLPKDFHKRHGLLARHKLHLTTRAPLSQQKEEFKQWLTSPFMLSRKGASQCSTSWENVWASVTVFLGHCHEYHQVSQPTLQLFLFPHLLAYYVSCLVTAQRSATYVSNMLEHFGKVLKWWKTKPGGNHPSFDEGLEWLKNLRSQAILLAVCCCIQCFGAQLNLLLHAASMSAAVHSACMHDSSLVYVLCGVGLMNTVVAVLF